MLPRAGNAISGAGFGNPALGGDGEWAAVVCLFWVMWWSQGIPSVWGPLPPQIFIAKTALIRGLFGGYVKSIGMLSKQSFIFNNHSDSQLWGGR